VVATALVLFFMPPVLEALAAEGVHLTPQSQQVPQEPPVKVLLVEMGFW
jgi:hypothetical protein